MTIWSTKHNGRNATSNPIADFLLPHEGHVALRMLLTAQDDAKRALRSLKMLPDFARAPEEAISFVQDAQRSLQGMLHLIIFSV